TLLRASGHTVTLAPLLRMEPLPPTDPGPGPWAALAFTSINAVRAVTPWLHEALRRLPVLAVGDRTADEARLAGFADVSSAGGDGGDLARLAAARFAGGDRPLLYLGGQDRARDLEGDLAAHGIAVRTVAVYRAVL